MPKANIRNRRYSQYSHELTIFDLPERPSQDVFLDIGTVENGFCFSTVCRILVPKDVF